MASLIVSAVSGGIGYFLGNGAANKNVAKIDKNSDTSSSTDASIHVELTDVPVIEKSTEQPTASPTEQLTEQPTEEPTEEPTAGPTERPTDPPATDTPVIRNTPSVTQNGIICSRKVNSGSYSNRSNIVSSIQDKLIMLGYLEDISDGIFGRKTEAAVKRFQAANGLPETGEVDQKTYDLLFSEEIPKEPDPDTTDRVTFGNGIVATSLDETTHEQAAQPTPTSFVPLFSTPSPTPPLTITFPFNL